MATVTAIPSDEFNVAKLAFSPLTPAEGKSDPFTRPNYGGQPWAWEFQNMKSYKGIQKSKFNSYFMNANFQTKADIGVCQTIESGIIQRIFENKALLLPAKAAKIGDKAMVDMIYSRLVSEGKDKPDGSGKYDDQVTVSVPSKKIAKNDAVVDLESVTIMNREGEIIPWDHVAGKPILKMGVLMEKINLGAEIKPRGTLCYLVVEAPAPIRILPSISGVKRQLDAPASSSSAADGSAAATSSTTGASSTAPAEQERKKVAVTKA